MNNFPQFFETLSNLNVDDLSLYDLEKLEQVLTMKLVVTQGQIRKLKTRKN